MNKHNAHLYLPLVHALIEGRAVQYRHSSSAKWEDGDTFDFSLEPECYRIRPEPREFWVCKSTKANSAFGDGTYQAFPYHPNDNNESPAWEYIRVREVID